MEYISLTTEQREILVESIRYDPNTDFNGCRGPSLANRLDKEFEGKIPRICSLTEEKLKFYEIINSIDPKILYNKMQRTLFKGLFGRLKKAGYKGSGESEMKNYKNMDTCQMWGYYMELRKELDIFS